ncbi:MAG TPA: hypothetical protein DIC41_03090 [Alphaproteobacteria bacterium]|nr:hypothetical protein [Rhodospirillaceae bacterium]HAO58018.1 hypothetical protein [Alphaproteobacteria bacterium]HBP58160.1 hypothetical protein [Alphaproteobacteria bacterium]HBP72600.1 hypothetical protein [Alphaproteobacteria bacterium]HCA92317.1 hypothetical protein [Alphaproteobacteria bacterium]
MVKPVSSVKPVPAVCAAYQIAARMMKRGAICRGCIDGMTGKLTRYLHDQHPDGVSMAIDVHAGV